MVNVLFPKFLVDPAQYKHSEQYWLTLWDKIDSLDRERFGWTQPWLGTGSHEIRDGNPIFSAHSPVLRRGIRVIQEEPAEPVLGIQAWLDSFGGDITDPEGTRELVISCVLSEGVSELAFSLMAPWVRGQAISLGQNETGLLLPSVI